MRCRDVQDLASSYIDGGLDDARSSALRGHARQCPACLAMVRELGAIRDAAADLDTLEPPPSLWPAVQRSLAEAEIADAGRSRLWLHWQALRPLLLPAAVALAAIAAVTTWQWRQPVAARLAATAPDTASVPRVVPAPADGFGEPFEIGRARALAEADQRYTDTLAELRGLVADERASWPAEVAARLDARLAAIANQARQQQHVAAAADPLDVHSRDALYAVYHTEIELLQNVALYGADALREDGLP